MGDFLDVVRRHKGLRGNMHAYSGSYESFLELQKLGDWYIGVGGVVTFKNASLAEVVKRVPLERIVLETDAPYLTPVPYRGRRNESSYIPYIAAMIAQLKGVSVEEVAETTTNNAKTLFGI
jgi:TatD DNase family protein